MPNQPKPWKKIDLFLVIAAMAETKEKRLREYARICSAYGLSTESLKKRLALLARRDICVSMGPRAVDKCKKQLHLLAEALRNAAQLIHALDTKSQSKNCKLRGPVTISFRRASQILHCRPEWLSSMVHDMNLLHLDENGKLTLDELLRFYKAEGPSLLLGRATTRKDQRLGNNRRKIASRNLGARRTSRVQR